MSSAFALAILKQQRGALLRAIASASPKDAKLLDGILALLDHIADTIPQARQSVT